MKVLLVDDHALFRAGLGTLLQAWGMEVIGEAGDGREAIIRTRHMLLKSVIGLSLLLLVTLLAGCGGSGAPDPAPTAVSPTAVPSPTTDLPTEPVPAATETPEATPPTDAGNTDQTELINQGKILFESGAGGVGCALCHGLDGKGDPVYASSPNRGATEEQIWNALTDRPQMSFITMTNDEVKAVAAYLKVLATQP